MCSCSELQCPTVQKNILTVTKETEPTFKNGQSYMSLPSRWHKHKLYKASVLFWVHKISPSYDWRKNAVNNFEEEDITWAKTLSFLGSWRHLSLLPAVAV